MNRFALLIVVLAAGCGGGDDGGDSAKLAINEVMPENKTACADAFGEYDDWFEVYNGGSSAVDLEGYYVSDDSTMPMKVQLAAGVSVPAHGVKLFWADSQVQGTDHVGFKLEKNGEDVVLSDPDGVVIDMITFGAATEDSSFARLPDGTGDMALCAHSTCGELNGDTCAP